MKVLWICNVILPEFSDEYNVKKTIWEGWISGMLSLLWDVDGVEVACCFPIVDEARMKQGRVGKVKYFSFHADVNMSDTVQSQHITEFETIYNMFNPDIIHIWGSEYNHSFAAACAAKHCGLSSKVVLHIQGIVSAIVPYYNYGVDSGWLDYKCNDMKSMKENELEFKKRGELEIETFKLSKTILGRTSWDKAYISHVSPDSNYKVCGEVLRKEFYDTDEIWNVKKIERHSLFVTQAGYALKGVHLILPAIKELQKEFQDIRLYIAGGGALASESIDKQSPYEQYIKSLIAKYDLEGCVLFTGLLDSEKMKGRFLRSHVFVSSSTIENSSNAIGEAQLLGVPVIATYTGGTPDLIEHGKTGLLYQMDADYMFADCVRQIFEDDELALKLSSGEQKVATERYNPGIVSTELLEIYREVVGESHD